MYGLSTSADILQSEKAWLLLVQVLYDMRACQTAQVLLQETFVIILCYRLPCIYILPQSTQLFASPFCADCGLSY